jgi:hypothetical protein
LYYYAHQAEQLTVNHQQHRQLSLLRRISQ